MQDKEEIIDTRWDNFTDMDLSEMWFESRGIDTNRTKIDDEVVLMISTDVCGEPMDILLHKAELECKADEWRYENE